MLSISLVVLSCSSENNPTSNSITATMSSGEITVNNNQEEINKRLKNTNQKVEVENASGFSTQADLAVTNELSLTLVAEIAPPVIDGKTVQATSIAMDGQYAVVSYNMKGEDYVGATDVLDLSSCAQPQITSYMSFQNSDVHSVSFDQGNVYMAQGGVDPAFPDKSAFFRVVELSGGKFTSPTTAKKLSLPGFAATSVFNSQDRLFATSGDNAGLTVFSKQSFAPQQFFDLHDARWVDAENGKVAVIQGTPGKLAVINEKDLTLANSFAVNGLNIAESKSTVELEGNKAFIAAGSGGVQVLNLENGNVLASIPQPILSGLAPEKSVTNGVSVDKDLLFISNGEAGVYVAQNNKNFSDSGSSGPLNLTLKGKLKFADALSVNHVAYRNSCLAVASGSGGVKILTVSQSGQPPAPTPKPTGEQCKIVKKIGCGYSTKLDSVTRNSDGTHAISYEIANDGSKKEGCKGISYASVEAVPGSYSNVSFTAKKGKLNLGPNLTKAKKDKNNDNEDLIQGFQIDELSNLGGGKAGSFKLSYTLAGNFYDQNVMIKSDKIRNIAEFSVADFENVLRCNIPEPTPAPPQPTPDPTPTAKPTPLPTPTAVPAPGPTPTPLPEVSVDLWKWGAKAAISFTDDEGVAEPYTILAPELERRGWRASFFVYTDQPVWESPKTWSLMVEAGKRGHEISNHTYNHPDLTTLTNAKIRKEIEKGIADLRQFVDPNLTFMSFAYPYEQTDARVWNIVKQYHRYARAGDHGVAVPPNPVPINDAHKPNWGALTAKANTTDIPVSKWNSWIDATVKSGGWFIEEWHGISHNGASGGWEPRTLDEFKQHFDHIESFGNDLWVDLMSNVGNYIEERETAKVTVSAYTNESITLSVEDNFEFKVALTLVVPLPSGWNQNTVSATQGGKAVEVRPAGIGKVRVAVVPDGSPVLILPQ
jgi:peptidoglycan/xylan/chitin deacetylase (PgdA/CDA1 family)